MVGSRASHLGWFGLMLLGQQLGWASGQTTCTSIAVSGVGDYDGTYELDSSVTYPSFRRAGGTTVYELYQLSDYWYLEGSDPEYQTFDEAAHPVDIILGWSSCLTPSLCDEGAALLQPVITCDTTSTPAPATSTCTSITVSDAEEYDGTYELDSSVTYPSFRRAGGTTVYELYQMSDYWYLDGAESGYKTFDEAAHPVDITLEWSSCLTPSLCDEGAALLQPVITCDTTSTPAPATSTCTSVAVSDVGELDGTYDLDSSVTYPYYDRAAGTTVYELYQLSDYWYLDGPESGYRTYDDAAHPVDITLEWSSCLTPSLCDEGAALLQPVITCEGGDDTPPTPSPTPSASDDESEAPIPTPPPTEEEGTGGVATEPPSPSSVGNPSTPSPETPAINQETPPPAPPAGDGDGEEGLSVGGIVGIIVGILAATGLTVGGCKFYCCNGTRNTRNDTRNTTTNTNTNTNNINNHFTITNNVQTSNPSGETASQDRPSPGVVPSSR
eukprot:g4954.t1